MSVSELSVSIKREQPEFNASEVRQVLQELFPTRKLVLSQFTFFNHAGVGRPSGEKFRRGRRCYQAQDLLPIAVVLALKEQGIPNKNIGKVPALIQENSQKIFDLGAGTRVSGFGDAVSLNFIGEFLEDAALDAMLASDTQGLFWSFDVGSLAQDINRIVNFIFFKGGFEEDISKSNLRLRAVA